MNSIEDIKRKSIQKKTNKELSTITIITVIDAQFLDVQVGLVQFLSTVVTTVVK